VQKGSLLSACTLLAKSLGNYRQIMDLVRQLTQAMVRTKGNRFVNFYVAVRGFLDTCRQNCRRNKAQTVPYSIKR
jgi:hypothetical protein